MSFLLNFLSFLKYFTKYLLAIFWCRKYRLLACTRYIYIRGSVHPWRDSLNTHVTNKTRFFNWQRFSFDDSLLSTSVRLIRLQRTIPLTVILPFVYLENRRSCHELARHETIQQQWSLVWLEFSLTDSRVFLWMELTVLIITSACLLRVSGKCSQLWPLEH